MSDAPTQPRKLLATLVVDDTTRLSGQLASLRDGQLVLAGPEILRAWEKPRLKDMLSSAFATLSLANQGTRTPPLEHIRVKVSEFYENRLTLQFVSSNHALANRYLDAISAAAAPKTKSAPPPSSVLPPLAAKTAADTATKTATTNQPDPLAPAAATGHHPKADSPARSRAFSASSEEYARLLEALQKQSLDMLRPALELFFNDLGIHLLDLAAAESRDNSPENRYYESAIIIQRDGKRIAHGLLLQVKQYFSNLVGNGEEARWQYAAAENDKLDLIGLQEFEDFLAIDRLVTLKEKLHSVVLEALTFRVAALVEEAPHQIMLPMDVRQLCRALQTTLRTEAVPNSAVSPIFDYFLNQFVQQLQSFYAPLNSLLAEQGVLPDIENELKKKGSLLEKIKQQPATAKKPKLQKLQKNMPDNGYDEMARSTDAPSNTGKQQWARLAAPNAAGLYSSVIDALNFRREAEGLTKGSALTRETAMSGTWDGTTVASAELDQTKLADATLIAKALSKLQQNSEIRHEVQETQSVRAYLARNRDKISELQDSSGLTTESLNQLDMVDNLFGTINSQLDVSDELKPALGNLQIPMAKLALLDPKFFADHSHTARAVVDNLSRLAASANFPNKALEDRISTVVDNIINDYENDATVFDTALTKINTLLEQQERAMARNIERVVKAQEGQQQLADARQQVNVVIRSYIKPPSAPKVLQELVDSGWRDLMVLTCIRNGTDDPAWADQIKALDMLSLWLNEKKNGENNNDLSVEHSMEANPFIDLIAQQISSALPTNIAHEEVLDELRDIFAGNLAIEMIPVGEQDLKRQSDSQRIRTKIEDLPLLRRWVRRVEQLKINSWLSYHDGAGQQKRMQLAWTSANRDRYIFVNERGQKVADLSAIRLARQLSRGVKPPAPTDEFLAVDQSMYRTLENVQKALSFARNHDALTKLINIETFSEQVKRALRHSQLKGTQHAVLYLDIDQFALVNKVYDRIIGDQVLLEFAGLLAQLHGKKLSSTRVKNDQFALLLLDQTEDQATALAQKIRSDIENSSVAIDGEPVSFTVSIGVATIREHSLDVESVLGDARSAMQHAKQNGGNQIAQYEEQKSRVLDFKLEKSQRRADLEDAIESERFILRAQPIMQTSVNDRSSSTEHFELLLGLLNDDGSISSPADFIQSAERYGFMTLVDRWVVREAFTWISQLMDNQKVVPHIAINLSGASVTDNSFMEYLLEKISEYGVGTSRLCFEITEAGTISNLVKAADFVRAFKNIGCKFSIDDFGTGMASHNYLRELPVDYVKIDGSFVTGIDTNRHDYAMARSINDLAHFLGQETIAESVESDSIIVKLEELGVDYIQGWGVGRLKPLTEVAAGLSSLEQ